MEQWAGVLARLRRFGPYFAFDVRSEPLGRTPVDAAGALVDVTAVRLGTDDRRVAGSIAFQGVAARLWSLTAGAAVVAEVVPDLPADAVRLAAVDPVTVHLVAPAGWAARDVAAGSLTELTLTRHLEPLCAAVHDAAGTPAHVLTSDAASALVGTLRVLAGDGALAGRVRALATDLFAHPELADTGTLDVTGALPAFRRKDCCLYYRVPGGGVCGDCVLRR